jgi:hypothetical protein
MTKCAFNTQKIYLKKKNIRLVKKLKVLLTLKVQKAKKK